MFFIFYFSHVIAIKNSSENNRKSIVNFFRNDKINAQEGICI